MKIIKSLEDATLLMKGVSEIVENEAKLGTLSASLLGNLLTGKVQLEQVKARLEQVKAQLEQARIFNAASSFN